MRELVTLAMDAMASIRALLFVVDWFADSRVLEDTMLESVDQDAGEKQEGH